MTATLTTRLAALKTWAASQFSDDSFCILSVAGDALVMAVRLPLAVVVIVVCGR